ncbi:MAG: hypothetical protein J07HQX50_00386 [Haloquadratum sp. J07HQX50]|jgi:hypothetical protein|nr:MAG: hypothetical protein J07HQX50_00386 [Haloquadratum sp. J07HQX50]
METASNTSDKAFGLTIVLSAIATTGVGGMFIAGVTGDQVVAAGGFAVAIISASLAVSASHLYDS